MDACIEYIVHDLKELHLRFDKLIFDVVHDGCYRLRRSCACSKMHQILKANGLFIIVTSRSDEMRMHCVDKLRRTHKRLFKKVSRELCGA